MRRPPLFVLAMTLALPCAAQPETACQLEIYLGGPIFSGDGGPAADARLFDPVDAAALPNGSIVVSDRGNFRMRRIAPDGMIETIAGSGPAEEESLLFPGSIVAGPDGSVYFVDGARIRTIDPAGSISTVVGTGEYGFNGDGLPGTETMISPRGLAFASNGGLVFTDGTRVRRLASGGVVETVGGNGSGLTSPFGGDGSPAVDVSLGTPSSPAVAPDGSIWFVSGRQIRTISPAGILGTVVGTGRNGTPSAGGALTTNLSSPSALTFDPDGTPYFVDRGLWRLTNGQIEPVGSLRNLRSVRFHSSGFAVGVDSLSRVLRIDSEGLETVVAGVGPSEGEGDLSGDAPIELTGFAFDASGRPHVHSTSRIYRVEDDLSLTRVAGVGPGRPVEGQAAIDSQLADLYGIAFDPEGGVYLAQTTVNQLFRIAPDGMLQAVAGANASPLDAEPTAYPDALQARIHPIESVAVDSGGMVYITELGLGSLFDRALRLSPDGSLTTLQPGYQTESNPVSVAVDRNGQVLVADADRSTIVRRAVADALYQAPGAPEGMVDTQAALATDSKASVYWVNRGQLWRLTVQGALERLTAVGTAKSVGPLGETSLGTVDHLAISDDGDLYLTKTGSFRVFRVRGIEGCSATRPTLVSGLTSSASFAVRASAAPGEILSIFGSNVGPEALATAQVAADGRLATELNGVEVLVDGVPAPLIFVSAGQTSFVFPFGAREESAEVEMRVGDYGNTATVGVIGVESSKFALFTRDSSGSGLAAALNQDGTIHGDDNPAEPGSVIVLFGTGAGEMEPAPLDGEIVGDILPLPVKAVTASIGSRPASVLYAGAAPGLVAGLLQVNVRIPEDVPGADSAGLEVRVGSSRSQSGVLVAIR